jgi:hypothetical protein
MDERLQFSDDKLILFILHCFDLFVLSFVFNDHFFDDVIEMTASSSTASPIPDTQ